MWTRQRPEFACAANSVSLLMPYIEPYVVRSVQWSLDQLDEDAAERTRAYLSQESQHHRQHRRFNQILVGAYPALERIEHWMESTFSWLESKRSPDFNLAFAAGFETVAFSAARWVDRHLELLRGGDPAPVQLFLWHLAEEVEHKSIAYEAYEKVSGSRLLYASAMLTSMLVLGFFAIAGTLTMFFYERRIFNPVAHFRMFVWSFSYLFVLLPVMFLSALPGHHPSAFTDPLYLSTWLRGYDPSTKALPPP